MELPLLTVRQRRLLERIRTGELPSLSLDLIVLEHSGVIACDGELLAGGRLELTDVGREVLRSAA